MTYPTLDDDLILIGSSMPRSYRRIFYANEDHASTNPCIFMDEGVGLFPPQDVYLSFECVVRTSANHC